MEILFTIFVYLLIDIVYLAVPTILCYYYIEHADCIDDDDIVLSKHALIAFFLFWPIIIAIMLVLSTIFVIADWVSCIIAKIKHAHKND